MTTARDRLSRLLGRPAASGPAAAASPSPAGADASARADDARADAAATSPAPSSPTPASPAPAAAARQVPDVVTRVRTQHLSYLPESALCDLYDLALEADQQGRPGVLVEAGCALGGSAIVLAAAKDAQRPLQVHDVFAMIPAPGERDGADVHARFDRISSGQATGIAGDPYYGYEDDLMAKVAASFDEFGLPLADNAVTLVPGLFQDTLPEPGAGGDPVALAHVDGDWYESVRTCLDRLGPRLVPGAVVVIDDYFKWSGCRTAVDEFLAEHPEDYERERRTRLVLRRR